MRRLNSESFQSLIDAKPTLVLGAGVSRPLLPIASALKEEIVCNALRCAESEINPSAHQLKAALRQPHLTLELLCSMLLYRCQQFGMSGATEMLRAVCDLSHEPHLTEQHAYSAYLAFLAQSGRVGPILTTNFDTLLTSAIPSARVITDRQLAASAPVTPTDGDICALHGTFHTSVAAFGAAEEYTPPSSTTAHGLVRPLTPQM